MSPEKMIEDRIAEKDQTIYNMGQKNEELLADLEDKQKAIAKAIQGNRDLRSEAVKTIRYLVNCIGAMEEYIPEGPLTNAWMPTIRVNVNEIKATLLLYAEPIFPSSAPVKDDIYPDADESVWPPQAKKSKNIVNFDDTLSLSGLSPQSLGEITSDGLRGYICTRCGQIITKAHHIKPETYTLIYKGQRFYLERHICDDCMNKYEVKKDGPQA